MYLLAIIINASNLDPIFVRDCLELPSDKIAMEIADVERGFKEIGLVCTKKSNKYVLDCIDNKNGLVGKVMALTDRSECKSYPGKLSNDLKKLLNRK